VVIAASSPPFATVTITTLISIVTLLSLVAGIYATLMQARTNRKSIETTKKAVDNNQAKIEDVHTIVNSRYDDLVKYVQVLSNVLKDADIKIPSPFQRPSVLTNVLKDTPEVVEAIAKDVPHGTT
jgi:hypothetical protein